MTLRAKLLTLSAALVCAVPLAAPAGATTIAGPAETEVTLRVGDFNQAPLFGRVSSPSKACVAGRKVTIIAISPSRGTLGPADNLTNAKGKWKFSSQLDGATEFMAKVKPKTVEGIKCEGATSPARSL